MAFSKETTILCLGCTEEEIRIIKQNLPNKNIQIAETEIAFELYVIPNFLTIINPETGESASLGNVSNGHIYIENDSATVLGYQFREMFNYDPITDWLGYDGNLHEIRYVSTLSK